MIEYKIGRLEMHFYIYTTPMLFDVCKCSSSYREVRSDEKTAE